MKHASHRWILFVSALAGLALSCQTLVGAGPTEVPVESTAAPTQVPPTEQPPATEGAPMVGEGVHLEIPPTVGTGASVEGVAAPQAPSDGPAFANYPDYLQVTLSGYALGDTFHEPRINLYPVAETIDRNEFAADTIAEVQRLIAERPASFPDPMPFLPIFNAGQMMHAQEAYLDGADLAGVRYLTQYAQAAYPINNHDLFYTFQGLTADGNTYVLGILPVSHPDLAATGDDLPGGDYQDFVDHYETYTQQSVDLLNGADGASFTPSLADLDAMLRSLSIE
jgi:hypothetical protein